MSATEKLVSFIEETTFEGLKKEITEHVKVCIIDWIGAALSGALEPSSRKIVSFVKEMTGREESTVVGMGLKVSCVCAALANGVIGHSVELDDIHEAAIIHPAATVIPAALAIAERQDMGGKDLMTAVALGYEVAIRIGMAVNPSHYQFWHPTGTCGTFGSTAAAGKLLCLDKKSMTYALGIAGTSASGLVEVFGSMSKPLNAGRAAMSGVISALLAQKGFTSSSRILESERGYLRATAEKVDMEKVTEKLGTTYELMNNVFKCHASCGHTHGAIDAVLNLVQKYGVRADDVTEILVGTYPIALKTAGGKYAPKTAAEAKFSLPYCVAAALFYGKVGLEEFYAEKMADPKILSLIKRVKVYVDPAYANARLGPARVTIRTKIGREYQDRVETPRGYPKNPLKKTEIEAKFKALSSLVYSDERIQDISKTVNSLEKIDKVKDLCALL